MKPLNIILICTAIFTLVLFDFILFDFHAQRNMPQDQKLCLSLESMPDEEIQSNFNS